MGCVSSKILEKSGSFHQEMVSSSRLGHSFQFQTSSTIEDMILCTSKSNGGDQFLALLCTSTSNSSVRKAKEPAEAHRPAPASVAKIETIHVSELLAGLDEEESCSCTAERARERRQSSRGDGDGDGSQALWSVSDGRARSFRTVEEFDAMVLTQRQQQTQSESGSPSERRATTALATDQEELVTSTAAASTAEAETKDAAAGAKRRARRRGSWAS